MTFAARWVKGGCFIGHIPPDVRRADRQEKPTLLNNDIWPLFDRAILNR